MDEPGLNVPGRFGPSHCPVCNGRESCRGGGVRACMQRDPWPSRIVAVLDTYGGVRTVVAYESEIQDHVRDDEIAILLPQRVHTPISWNDIPGLIAHAKWVLEQWIENNRPNEPHAIEAVKMYRLRCLEQGQRSFDPRVIAET